jgi:2'-5' RNA ligase
MSETERFIIITVPPADVADRLDVLRCELSELSGSRGALAYPPHVTLRTGAVVPIEEVEGYAEEFARYVEPQRPFRMHTEGVICTSYRSHEEERTKYIVLMPIAQIRPLMELNRNLLRYTRFRKSDKTTFRPHLTLAFDDLSGEGLRRLEAHVERYPERFAARFEWTCDNVRLCMCRDGEWVDFRVYRLLGHPLTVGPRAAHGASPNQR